MKTYTIKDAAELMEVSPSTLRYYDKEGLLPFVQRSDSGYRVFTEDDLGFLKTIECLKQTEMPIKDIKQYMDWWKEGDSTLEIRLQMFKDRKQIVLEQMKMLEKTIQTIDFKLWYYEEAIKLGSEQRVLDLIHDKQNDKM